jgi:hypothetical protein
VAEPPRQHHEHSLGRVWLVLCLALAVHVFDEAVTGFVPEVNSLLQTVSHGFALPSVPVVSYAWWLGALSVLVCLLLALTRPVSRGARLTRLLPYVLAWVSVANGLGHIVLSLWVGCLLPGTLSSPLLLLASVNAFTYLSQASRRAALAQQVRWEH